MTGPLRSAASFALHSGLQSDGTARLMRMTAAGSALGGGGGGSDGSDGSGPAASETKAISTDPDDGDVFAMGSERMHDELMASGIEPRPKGRKPIVGWNEASESAGDAGSRDGDGDGAEPAAATATDAWKYKDLPPGKGFLYPVRPGVHRFYLDHDAKGLPKMVGLDPVWPDDEAEGNG